MAHKKFTVKAIIGMCLLTLFVSSRGWAQGDLLNDILTKVENIPAVSYVTLESDSVTADRPLPRCIAGDPGITETKIWVKKGYLRREINSPASNAKKVIQVYTPEGGHIYNFYSNETTHYEKSSFVEMPSFTLGIVRKNADAYKIVGTEMLEDKPTTILEWSYGGDSGDSDDNTVYHAKYWIWNEKGVPLKEETTWIAYKVLNMKSVEEFKDYSFDDIPESVFDIANIPEIQSSTIVPEKK